MIDAGTALLRQFSDLIVALGLAIGAGLLVYRKAVLPALRMGGEVRDAFVATRQLVEAQLTPNGGGSLLDLVAKIEPNHKDLGERIDMLGEKVDGRFTVITNELDRRRAMMAAVIGQVPEPQRSAIRSIIESLGGGE